MTIDYDEWLYPVCEDCGIEMSPFTDIETDSDGWRCDDCGWSFLESEGA